MLYKVLLVIISLITSTVAIASEQVENSVDDAMINLLKIIENESEIATKNKMNTDFVPGMVTVLHGRDLEAMGIDTVWKAMRLIPGVHIRISQQGDLQVVTRGLGGEVMSPEIKTMIDNRPAHNAFLGFGPSLYLPIGAVERIEVIRGPGASLYGDYAFAGVINIITRKGETRVMTQYGSHNTYQGSAIISGRSDNDKFSYSLLASRHNTDGDNAVVGPDALGQFGQPDKRIQTDTAIVNMTYDKTSLYGRIITLAQGNHFGLIGALEPANQRGGIDSTDIMVGIKQDIDLSESVDLELHADYTNYEVDSKFTIVPPANNANLYYKERKYLAGLQLNINSFDRHRLLIGLDYSDAKPENIWWTANFFSPAPGVYVPIPTTLITGANNWVREDIERKTTALFIQDQYSITEQLMLTTGVRYDTFSDVGESINPRIGLVYNIDNRHIFKAQFARASRPPTLYEKYENTGTGNINLKAETIDTFEVGYIYTTLDTVIRTTLFDSRVKNLIGRGLLTPYQNLQDTVKLNGAEIEVQKNLTGNLRLDGNISYVRAINSATKLPLEGSANILGNLILTWQPIQNYTVTIWGNHVGARNRAAGDTRSKLAADTTIDVAFGALNLFNERATVRAGVKNVFDRKVKYPAPQAMYQNDYPGDRRTFWGNIAYSF
ncbi:TonB-dependent receptor plug domain-containing protein [Pseudomonadota bacterium]